MEITNNTSPLYFAFNCDALIDVYSSYGKSDLIPENEYQAISTYTTSGRILDDLTKMTDVYNTPCYYQYVELGYCDYVYELKDEFNISNKIVVNLASEYALAVNDNFQLFYRGVIEAVNPYNYGIEVKCSKGSQYPRYYEWTPTISDLGRYSLILNVYDNNGQLLGSDKTMLKVYDPLKTNEKQNILCFGDSLTAGGTWVKEAARRYISSNGKPAGLGLDYLNFVGGKKMNFDGKEVGYEGTGGWTWATYLGESSPFYNPATKTIDFKYYTNKIGVTTLDECYILLTWNGMGTPYKKDFSLNEGHFKQAQVLIDQLHKDYPACKVRLMGLQMPSQNGGMGTNYGATGGYSSAYGMLVTAMNYNKTLEKLCMSDKYKDFTKFIDIAAQFDTDYNMPSTSKPVNNRSDVTEIIGTNGVHPSVNGYYQIADAVFRSLCRDYASNEVL